MENTNNSQLDFIKEVLSQKLWSSVILGETSATNQQRRIEKDLPDYAAKNRFPGHHGIIALRDYEYFIFENGVITKRGQLRPDSRPSEVHHVEKYNTYINKYINNKVKHLEVLNQMYVKFEGALSRQDTVKVLANNYFEKYIHSAGFYLYQLDLYHDEVRYRLLLDKHYKDTIMNKSYVEKFENAIDKLLELLAYKGSDVQEITHDKNIIYFCFAQYFKKVLAVSDYNNFKKQYGGYFQPLGEDSTLEEYVKVFYSIEFIDPNKMTVAAPFVSYLITERKFPASNSVMDCFVSLKNMLDELNRNKKFLLLERELLKQNSIEHKELISLDDVDMMTGPEFELFICELYRRMGYSVNQTKLSGDQGIDVVAVKNGVRIGIQAKRYSNAVTNKAVQEVVAGMNHYQLSKAIVVTNSSFTSSAIELAQSNGVVLWDRSMIAQKLLEYFNDKK